MKLIFTKDGEDIKIEIGAGTVTEEFDYVKMVQSLIDNNEIETPQFSEGITEDERATIKIMLQKIQDAIASDESEEEDIL